MFEKILDDAADNTGWNESTKYSLVLDFLEAHCQDKLEQFQEVISSVEFEGMSSNSI